MVDEFDNETFRGGVWIVDVSHLWVKAGEKVHKDGSREIERDEGNVVLELVSINELGDKRAVASLQIRGMISPKFDIGGVIECKKRHGLYIVGQNKVNGTGGPIVIPDDHYAFEVGVYYRGDSEINEGDLTFHYTYRVEHEEIEQLEIPKSKALQDFGTW